MKIQVLILISIVLLSCSHDSLAQPVPEIDAEASYKKMLGELKDLERLSDEKTVQIESLKKKNKQLVEEIEELTAKLATSGDGDGSDRNAFDW